MRKSYIQPTLTVVHIAQVQMIAASDTGLKTKGDAADASESLVKSFNSNSDIWDDDDYKDE